MYVRGFWGVSFRNLLIGFWNYAIIMGDAMQFVLGFFPFVLV